MDKDIICGYTQPHPFEKYIYIDISYKNNTFNQIRELFIKVIDKINKILDDLKKDFEGSSTKKIPRKRIEKKRNHKKLNQHWMIMKILLHLKRIHSSEDDTKRRRNSKMRKYAMRILNPSMMKYPMRILNPSKLIHH